MGERSKAALVVGVAGAAVFAAGAVAAAYGPPRADRSVTSFLAEHHNGGVLRACMHLSHFLGNWRVVALLVGALALVLFLAGRTAAAVFAVSALAVLPLGDALKELFRRQPPLGPTASSYSFPSGHALSAMVLAGAVVALCARTPWRLPAAVLAAAYVLAIGVAVVAAGGHWPSDVLAGWGLALSWLAVSRSAVLTVARRRS